MSKRRSSTGASFEAISSLADGCVAAYGLASPAGHGIAVPGFVDLQVNGFGGVDLLDADASGYRRAGQALVETGVTAYLPTFITSPEERLLAALREVPPEPSGPRVLGVHLEGPFLSPLRLGAHPGSDRRDPDVALLGRLLEAGPIRMVTLAPELPGAAALIEELVRREVTVSCGHSDATAAEAEVAFDAGARTVTHLFNAMRPFHHRDPGLAGAALAREDIVVQAILDGVHLAPETASIVWRAAAGRLALVTDAMAGAGLADGSYRLGGVNVKITDRVPRGNDGALAGSTLTMIEAARNLHELGASFEETIAAATAVPARVLRLSDVGRLEIGPPADVVVLNDSLEIERVLVAGQRRSRLTTERWLAGLRSHLVQDCLEQAPRREDVLTREHPRALRAARGHRFPDGAVLEIVLAEELVEVGARGPYGLDEERAARGLRHPLDERNLGDGVDHVVERVVGV